MDKQENLIEYCEGYPNYPDCHKCLEYTDGKKLTKNNPDPCQDCEAESCKGCPEDECPDYPDYVNNYYRDLWKEQEHGFYILTIPTNTTEGIN